MAIHGSHVFYNLESYVAHHAGEESDWPTREKYEQIKRYWTLKWKKWSEKHSGEPIVSRCAICSGKEFHNDVKAGRWKLSTREEKRLRREELEE